jgi:hypothetical protein
MIKEKKLTKINDALSQWDGASAEFLDFIQSMGNNLVLGIFKGNEQVPLRLTACQHIKAKVYLNNIAFYCEQTVFDGCDCFLLKDANSDLEIVVGSAIHIGETVVTVSE